MNEIEKGPFIKNNFNSQNIFYISLSVAIIIIAFSFFYYNVIYKPQLDKNKIELQKIEQEKKLELQRIEQENALENKTKMETEIAKIEAEYLECKKNARDTYEQEWVGECKRIGKEPNTETPLPVIIAERLSKYMQERLELCEKEYKIKLETVKLKQD